MLIEESKQPVILPQTARVFPVSKSEDVPQTQSGNGKFKCLPCSWSTNSKKAYDKHRKTKDHKARENQVEEQKNVWSPYREEVILAWGGGGPLSDQVICYSQEGGLV